MYKDSRINPLSTFHCQYLKAICISLKALLKTLKPKPKTFSKKELFEINVFICYYMTTRNTRCLMLAFEGKWKKQ